LASYISRVFLKTYRICVQQLSYYYGQPHVNCYMLHVELLANDLDDSVSTVARTAILGTILNAAERAQQQILVLAGHGSSTGDSAPGATNSAGPPAVGHGQLNGATGRNVPR